MFIFNNVRFSFFLQKRLIFSQVTSLPLLLISALAATGGLDPLVTADRPLERILKTGRVYILINALVGNLTRFALGPCKFFFFSFFSHFQLERRQI
jgi:hypothetical protein